MRFPETLREEEGAHGAALRRRDSARNAQQQLAENHWAAEGTADEAKAMDRLDAARTTVAAREAWLAWVELDSV
jgi:hypothetical protein